ncbi:transposase [bacterium]|nr:transposase [bacterium]
MPDRKYTRLKHYDYRSPGAYFVTICTQGRRMLFGELLSSEVMLSALGKLVLHMLGTIADHHGTHVRVDSFVIMPNHLHLILFLHADPVTFQQVLKDGARNEVQPGEGGVLAGSLGAIIGSFKAAVTREWRRMTGTADQIWQSGFHEHVVRHERALERIREYIRNNPRQWELDRENPRRSGEAGFYKWLDSYDRYLKSL